MSRGFLDPRHIHLGVYLFLPLTPPPGPSPPLPPKVPAVRWDWSAAPYWADEQLVPAALSWTYGLGVITCWPAMMNLGLALLTVSGRGRGLALLTVSGRGRGLALLTVSGRGRRT